MRMLLALLILLSGPCVQKLSAQELDYHSLSFENLKKFIIERNIKSIEELLPLLPDQYRSKYVMMFNSRSVQYADFDNPRVIMTNGYLTMSFSGTSDPKKVEAQGEDIKHRTLEMYEYVPDGISRGHLEFREIVFPKDQKGAVEFVGGDELRSPENPHGNPDTCIRCHGNSAYLKPNFDESQSFLWPGAYFGVGGPLERPALSGMFFTAQKENGEELGFKKMLATKDHHPRYRYLLTPNRGKLEFSLMNQQFNSLAVALSGLVNYQAIKESVYYDKNKYTLLYYNFCLPTQRLDIKKLPIPQKAKIELFRKTPTRMEEFYNGAMKALENFEKRAKEHVDNDQFIEREIVKPLREDLQKSINLDHYAFYSLLFPDQEKLFEHLGPAMEKYQFHGSAYIQNRIISSIIECDPEFNQFLDQSNCQSQFNSNQRNRYEGHFLDRVHDDTHIYERPPRVSLRENINIENFCRELERLSFRHFTLNKEDNCDDGNCQDKFYVPDQSLGRLVYFSHFLNRVTDSFPFPMVYAPAPKKPSLNVPDPVLVCISCHDQSDSEEIPFADREKLKDWMQKKYFYEGVEMSGYELLKKRLITDQDMPPVDGFISSQERDEINQYLEEVQSSK